ncbi:hypothetical protein FIBSPDRAFT_846671 [Athelia psychrophila]|uniref:Uncharacterized protein n=1 Tax=Athelia psychrophila TaxID=1759441 RepID=A0A166X8X3_9AGAM|nr:hypothetical protein FIBSPDRAFT_846671 [Fibularhizoctonia sp. CBS 109695]
MSLVLARAALHARPTPAAFTAVSQRRLASSSSHDEHHHDEHHGSEGTDYGKESGFLTPFWGSAFALAAVTAGFYKFAPAPGDELYITRYIGQFKTPSEAWARLNEQHLIAITDEGEAHLLQASATRPPTHRYRYPQRFDFASPHLTAVGSEVDLSGVVAKGCHQ